MSRPEAIAAVRVVAAAAFEAQLQVCASLSDDPLMPLVMLPANAPLEHIESSLLTVKAALRAAPQDPLRMAVLRERAHRELKRAGVTFPGKFVDAAIAPEPSSKERGQGRELKFEDPEPWPDPVAGAAVLTGVADLFLRYLVLPPGAAEVLALWTAHTYVFPRFDHTPYINVTSPRERCGKSSVLRIARALAHRPLSAEHISPSALFRVIEETGATLLLDEVDRLPADSDIWGVLNSGHQRNGTVIRVVGEELKPHAFATYAPKFLCYIRSTRTVVPRTVEDRSIRIALQRRVADETREKIRTRELEDLARPLRSKLVRWTDDAFAGPVAAPIIPAALNDRAADGWEPLLTIAELAGGGWAAAARELAARFSAEREDEGEDITRTLLVDLEGLLESRALDSERGVAAEQACRLLRELPDRPWSRWGRAGDGLNPVGLARLLRDYGLRTQLVGGERVKRYPTAALRDVIARYTSASASHPLSDSDPLSASVQESTPREGERVERVQTRSERVGGE